MMTDEQKSKVAELKATVAATATAAGGAPAKVREAILALKKELRRDGTTARELASALGLHETTLCRWERDEQVGSGTTGRRRASSPRTPSPRTPSPRAPSFRRVQITAPETTPARPASASLTVPAVPGLRVAHAPSGLVIDGLDVETLAALLRRMS